MQTPTLQYFQTWRVHNNRNPTLPYAYLAVTRVQTQRRAVHDIQVAAAAGFLSLTAAHPTHSTTILANL